MSSTKNKAFYLFFIILSSLLISTVIFAVDKREITPIEKVNLQPQPITLQNQDDGNATTCENWWKAKQANDFAKAERIRAILEEEAKKVWRSPANSEIMANLPRFNPPQFDYELFKPYRWGNDVTITTGPVYSGISSDYDTSGNLYAARCTTWVDSGNADIRVYKSANGGGAWSHLNDIYYPTGDYKFSYPVVVTGSNPSKIYIFALSSSQNGNIGVARLSRNGVWENWYNIKADADTITYFSACTDDGSHLMVAYQKDENEHNIHKIYTITSTDSGTTWGNQTYITADGQHPDIAYGDSGYVYLTYESTIKISAKNSIPYYEIQSCKNTNYCAPLSWQDFQALTDDDYDDHYPKIAALHTTPEDTACVWVAYNHESGEKDTLIYDDGTIAYQFPLPDAYGDNFFNVRFTPAWDYWLESAQFLFFYKKGAGGIRVYLWADTSGFPAEKIDSIDVTDANVQVYPNWTNVSFTAKGKALTERADFHIGYTLLSPSTDTIAILSDDGLPTGTEYRSIEFYGGTWGTMFNDWGVDYNFMIRAVVTRMPSTDLRFAYSTNSGKDWSKNHELANSGYADEMAANLKSYRSSSNLYVDLCYLKYYGVVKSGSDICYVWAKSDRPEYFSSPPEIINEHWANWSPDGREVCQLTYPIKNEYPGIVYAGAPTKKDEGRSFVLGGWDLYYNNYYWVGVEDETEQEDLPTEFSLSNNFPNPFNPVTSIRFSVAGRQYAVGSMQTKPIPATQEKAVNRQQTSSNSPYPTAKGKAADGGQWTADGFPLHTTLKIYNVLGQVVRSLVDEPKMPGTYEVIWDGKDENGNQVVSGVYFYKLQSGNFTQTRKMVLIR